jgi:hypothetical protein
LLNRSQAEYESNETLKGEAGLWLAILIGLLRDIEDPCRRSAFEEARRIILFKEGCFNIMADALNLQPGELQKRIIRALKRRGIDLQKEKTKE